MDSKRKKWHRWFGLMLMDYFHGTGYEVELEKDLSVHRQLLDVVIVRSSPGARLQNPCAGFEDITDHNLITFKGPPESLTWWVLDELVGHYVNYRKCLGLKAVNEDAVRLYAVSARRPVLLDSGHAVRTQAGVYELMYGRRYIRIVVMSEMGTEDRNAIWELFSGRAELARHGAEHYAFHKTNSPGVLLNLFNEYSQEGFAMPYTWDDFNRDFIIEHVTAVPIEKIINQFKPEDVFKQFKPEDVFKQFKPEDVFKQFKPEDVFKQFKPEDVFKQFKPEEMEAYLKKLSDDNGKQPQTVRDEPADYSKEKRRMPAKRKIVASTH